MEKINIAEILKDCPMGTLLYATVHGEVKFSRISSSEKYPIEVATDSGVDLFTEDGRLYPNKGECVLFPSKDQRDWSKFQRPFKDGDIVVNKMGKPFILKSYDLLKNYVCTYCGIDCSDNFRLSSEDWTVARHVRYATEEEKARLFQAIKDNGYKWDAETKTLEKLIVPNKFDISTLIPFESRVLIRNSKGQYWIPAFWGYKAKDEYVTTFGHCIYCIPFEGNEHLLGTTGDCSDYYKNW